MKITKNNVNKVEEEIAQLGDVTVQSLREDSGLWLKGSSFNVYIALKRPHELRRYYHYLCERRKRFRGYKLTQDLGIQF